MIGYLFATVKYVYFSVFSFQKLCSLESVFTNYGSKWISPINESRWMFNFRRPLFVFGSIKDFSFFSEKLFDHREAMKKQKNDFQLTMFCNWSRLRDESRFPTKIISKMFCHSNFRNTVVLSFGIVSLGLWTKNTVHNRQLIVYCLEMYVFVFSLRLTVL